MTVAPVTRPVTVLPTTSATLASDDSHVTPVTGVPSCVRGSSSSVWPTSTVTAENTTGRATCAAAANNAASLVASVQHSDVTAAAPTAVATSPTTSMRPLMLAPRVECESRPLAAAHPAFPYLAYQFLPDVAQAPDDIEAFA